MKLPSLGDLGDIAKMKALQNELKNIVITHEYNGVKISVRADMQVQEVVVDGVVENRILVAINEALKKIQTESAKKIMAMG